MTRITEDTPLKQAIIEMAEGYVLAEHAILMLFKFHVVDAVTVLERLDEKGVYGSRIWKLFDLHCGRDLKAFVQKVLEPSFVPAR